jgi:hypothetical protein
VHDPGAAFSIERQSTSLEYFQHRGVLRQDLCDQFPEPSGTSNRNEMVHQGGANPLALVLVDYGESDFCFSRLDDNVTSAPDYRGSAAFLHQRDQGDVTDEIGVQVVRNFLFRKAFLRSEEAAKEGLGAGAVDRGEELIPVLWPESADFGVSSITQQHKHRIMRGFQSELT